MKILTRRVAPRPATHIGPDTDRTCAIGDGDAVRATLIYNPVAGRRSGADLDAVQALLAARGWTLRAERTSGPGAATRLARAAVERGDDVVVVAGGDGTINEAVQALAGSKTALAVVPIGTVNVWAREIGLPEHPVAAAEALAGGVCRRVDLGRAGTRLFLLMAGVGFDGAVTGWLEPRMKRSIGRWAYVVTALRLALRYGGIEATLQLDHETVTCRVLLAVVGNTRLYAGQLTFTPDAIADDGLLDVVVFPGRRLWQALPHLVRVLMGRRPDGSRVLYYRTRRLRITATAALPVQADGDYIGDDQPLDVFVLPAALRVIVPHTTRTALFQMPAQPPSKSTT